MDRRALAIEHEQARAETLAAFLPLASDPAGVLRSARQAVADHLLKNLFDARCEEVLRFCADENLSAPPILNQDTLGAIASYIIEVCEEWRWM